MAKNEILICDKCRHMSVKAMLPKLKKLAPDAEIKVGCKSYCGPCRRYAYIYINGRHITGATPEEALEKAAKFVKT